LRRALVVQLIAALLVTAAGATGLVVKADETDLYALTKEAATKVGTYRFKMTQQFSSEPGKPALPGGFSGSGFTMQGAFDTRKKLGRTTYQIKFPGASVSCVNVFGEDGLYVQVHPSRRAELGATWLKADAAAVTAQGLGFRPDELYSKGKDFYASIEKDGTEVIDGVETTRYKGVQDLSAFVPKAADSAFATVLKDVRTVPYELFVDGDDLLRRMTFSLTSQGLTVKTVMDVYDYGKPVAVAVPAASETKPGDQTTVAQACFPKALPGRSGT
jgi:hypothetical protein